MHHAFDGDGMLHLLSFRNGQVQYRNRFLRTKGFEEEQAAGHALYAGLIDNQGLRSVRAGARAAG